MMVSRQYQYEYAVDTNKLCGQGSACNRKWTCCFDVSSRSIEAASQAPSEVTTPKGGMRDERFGGAPLRWRQDAKARIHARELKRAGVVMRCRDPQRAESVQEGDWKKAVNTGDLPCRHSAVGAVHHHHHHHYHHQVTSLTNPPAVDCHLALQRLSGCPSRSQDPAYPPVATFSRRGSPWPGATSRVAATAPHPHADHIMAPSPPTQKAVRSMQTLR